jgi:hypothetical protein
VGDSAIAVPVPRATPAARSTIKPKLAVTRNHGVRGFAHRHVEHRTAAAHRRGKHEPQTLLIRAEVATVASRDYAGLLLLIGAIAMGVVVISGLRLRRILTRLNAASCGPPGT